MSKYITYNWVEIQKYYDENHTWVEVAKNFNISNNGLSYGCKNGLFVVRTKSESVKLSHIKNPKKLSQETKEKISKSRKKYLDENPGKIPYLLNHSSKESYPEKLLREKLIKENIVGWTQEYPIYRYSLDFAFLKEKINIEVDGSTHNIESVIEKDKIRNKRLNDDGWVILRISDYDVKNNLNHFISDLKKTLHSYSLIGKETDS